MNDLVPVKFQVKLPKLPGEVFIAADFAPHTALPTWFPATVLLTPDRKRVRTVSVPLPRGRRLEYKYNEGGSWDRVETDRTCAQLPNRVITVEPGLVVHDKVIAWADDCWFHFGEARQRSPGVSCPTLGVTSSPSPTAWGVC